MRAAFFLLLLLNAAFLAWSLADLDQSSGEAQLLNQQINPRAVRLLTPEQVAALAAQRAKAPPKPVACLELGSFNPAGDAPRVEQALAPLALGPRLSQRRVEETANYWVFMPPQASRQAALQKTAELKKLGVGEFFVVQDDARFRFAVSLGVFKSEDAAKARLEQLHARGVRSAQVGKRETQVPKVYFRVRDVAEALAVKLNELRQGFPGSELKECPPEDKKA